MAAAQRAQGVFLEAQCSPSFLPRPASPAHSSRAHSTIRQGPCLCGLSDPSPEHSFIFYTKRGLRGTGGLPEGQEHTPAPRQGHTQQRTELGHTRQVWGLMFTLYTDPGCSEGGESDREPWARLKDCDVCPCTAGSARRRGPWGQRQDLGSTREAVAPHRCIDQGRTCLSYLETQGQLSTSHRIAPVLRHGFLEMYYLWD